jgi:hypothetical protein
MSERSSLAIDTSATKPKRYPRTRHSATQKIGLHAPIAAVEHLRQEAASKQVTLSHLCTARLLQSIKDQPDFNLSTLTSNG